jgi:NAD(P)-dependent dehydrogenase (short-subunit alcohol dehydrogenase family)
VRRFLQEGARVVMADINAANADAALSALARDGHADNVTYIRADVAEEADVAAMIGRAVERFGRLDCVFNNAGVGGAFGPIAETTVADWDYTFAVLVRSVFLGIKHAAPVMQAQGRGGSILSTASIAGITGGNGSHAYSAAKAAVINLTRSVAMEMAPQRIRVNAIAPGVIDTPLFQSGRAEKMRALASEKMLWPRLGSGDDIAAAALFLASDEAAFITGQTLVVDGGLTAQGANLWGIGPDSPMYRKSGVNRGSTGQTSEARPLGPAKP